MSRIVPGIHSAREALVVRPKAVKELWLREGNLNPELEELEQLAKKSRVGIKRVAQKTLERQVASHQGVIAFVDGEPAWPSTRDLKTSATGFILALDSLEDPHNVGSIMRTAWGMGALGVIVTKSHSAGLAPASQKVASGGFEHVPVLETANLAAELKSIKDLGFWVYGLEGHAEKSVESVELAKKSVLVLGAEEGGLRKPVASMCDELVRIPQVESFQSYNVAVAGAMVCYEFTRQQKSKP